MDPSGIFSTSYARDSALVRTRAQWLALALFGAALLLYPWLASPRLVAVANLMLVTSIVVVGLQITTGYAGQINLGQAAFMGVGAYGASVVEVKFGLPFWVAVPVGGVLAGLAGWAFGLTAARIKGFYLALTTIAAQFLFVFVVLNLPSSWLGGVNGFSLEPARLGPLVFDSDRALYHLFLFCTAVMVFGAFGILTALEALPFPLFGLFDPPRDPEVAHGWEQDEIAARKRYMGADARALARQRIFDHLDDQLLARLQQVIDRRVIVVGVARVVDSIDSGLLHLQLDRLGV